MGKYLIISASVRGRGRSAALSEALRFAYEDMLSNRAASGGDSNNQVQLVSLAELNVAPCVGCNVCAETVAGRDPLYCVISDDMTRLRTLINECDELIMVTPVYFAGVPAQCKSLLDRFQPFYYHGYPHDEKRPAHLYVVGEGGDPHGFVPAVATVRSALAVAGFCLETVHDWVGSVDGDGALHYSGDIFQGGRVHPADEYYCVAPDGVFPRNLRDTI